ncbi:MAG TPA: alanine:cation symporter family protein, partial [Cytophagaceae bacterium]
QAASQVSDVFFNNNSYIQSNTWIIGLFMAIAVGVVIIGGITAIGRVAEILVPFMCGIYMIAGFVIIFFHYKYIPQAIFSILDGAVSPDSIKGGIAGVILQGFQRASFSNEAGIGSAPIAHAAVKTNEPITQGMVGLLEPFIDTVVVCTMTALIIVISKTYTGNDLNGIAITSAAFAQVISWFPYVLAIAVLLFAYATMLSWSYYGSKSWNYLFGASKFSDLSFKFIFCCFTIIGSSMTLDNVVVFSDAMIFAMAIPNIVGLYVMANEIKVDLKAYLKR